MGGDKQKKRESEAEILKSISQIVRVLKLSENSKEVTVAKWHKEIGESIDKGDLLVELETDTSTVDLESYSTGVLLYKSIIEGGTLDVNDIILVIGLCKKRN